MRALVYVLAFGLAVYAVADCARTPQDRVPGGLPKALWLLLIILIAYLGPIAWIIVSRVSAAEARGAGIGRGVWSSEDSVPLFTRDQDRDVPREPRAPDDDEDFLFSLEAQIYRDRKQRESRAAREAGHERSDEDAAPGDPEAGSEDSSEPGPQATGE